MIWGSAGELYELLVLAEHPPPEWPDGEPGWRYLGDWSLVKGLSRAIVGAYVPFVGPPLECPPASSPPNPSQLGAALAKAAPVDDEDRSVVEAATGRRAWDWFPVAEGGARVQRALCVAGYKPGTAPPLPLPGLPKRPPAPAALPAEDDGPSAWPFVVIGAAGAAAGAWYARRRARRRG